MAQRREPPDSLDYFPTPPWATRAGARYAFGIGTTAETCWEPACGEGHMASVLAETFRCVYASDVHNYGAVPQRVGSFVGQGLDVLEAPAQAPDWVITNPPFNLAVEFAERAIAVSVIGCALLVRTAWLESAERYRRLFSIRPPAVVAQFVERVRRQTDALLRAGVMDVNLYTDKKSGATMRRKGLEHALLDCRPGDVLVAVSVDRLSRSIKDRRYSTTG